MCSRLDYEECLTVATEVAKKAGQIIKDTCGKVTCVQSKSSYADLVTETDRNVEKFVFEELKSKFPTHKFIGEESVSDGTAKVDLTDEPTWIVDPVDGTMNFVHTCPYVAVCIGLSVSKSPVLGVVYCPGLDQLFTARRGHGAFLNGVRINVRPSPNLMQSLILAEIGSDRSEERRACVFKNLESIAWKCHGIRSLGSAAMNICAVAQGHADAFYEFGLHCWDICAPSAILIEAGGCVRDTQGGTLDLLKRRVIAAASKEIASELSEALVVQLDLPSD